MKILLSIVSTGKNKDFAKKIQQLERFKIKEIALFPTYINYDERQKLYRLLESSTIEKIPFVHLRNDMEIPEIDYLVRRFKTEIFNIHGKNPLYPFNIDLSKYAKRIYLETQIVVPPEEEFKRFAGVCLDVSHLRDFKTFSPEKHRRYLELLKKYPCGCGHISAINYLPHYYRLGKNWCFSQHRFYWLHQFNYIKQYKNILPPLMALELENDIPQQLKAKEYIEKILT